MSQSGSTSGSPKRPSARAPRDRVRVQMSLRKRFGLGGIVIGFFVLLALSRAGARFYTDYLWFRELRATNVWGQLFLVRTVLGVLFTATIGALTWFTVAFAQNKAPRVVRFAPNEELLAVLNRATTARPKIFRSLITAFTALTLGPVMASQWNNWLLFRNGGNVGQTVPKFGGDIGFYIFKLPFIQAIVGWILAALITLVIVALLVHTIGGSLRFGAGFPRAERFVRTHITVLFVVIAIFKAIAYWLDRYRLTLSTTGYVVGASYTDLAARRRGLELLAILSLVVAGLLLFSIRRESLRIPLIGGVVWVVVAIVTTGLYPQVLGRIVKSDEQNRERFSIATNIAATRSAFGLDKVISAPIELQEDANAKTELGLSEKELAAAQTAKQSLRLWEPSGVTGNLFKSKQAVKQFNRFGDGDADRYVVDGKLTPVVIAARELSTSSSDIASSWVKSKLAYTHGYGLVAIAANDKDHRFLAGNDPSVRLSVKQPRIYFGEMTDTYAIVGSNTPEVDLGSGSQEPTSTYKGKGGVAISGIFRRLAFALRFGDVNLLISKEVTSQARIMYVRTIRSRAQSIAPFLQFDADPYPVIANDRIVWVLDGYTTTARYPSSQFAPEDATSFDSGLHRSLNYVRNSVKVIVDAYDGTTTFYATDTLGAKAKKDPILSAYQNAFPGLFHSVTELRKTYPTLIDHLRYPQDLLKVQAAMLGRYQITDPATFFKNSSRWDVSGDPGNRPAKEKAPIDPTVVANPNDQGVMDPYYLLGTLPGSTKQHFFAQSNFVTWSEDGRQQNIRAILVAHSDADRYGELNVFTTPTDRQIGGPVIVARGMSSVDAVSKDESLLNTGGSRLFYGSMLVVPVGQSLLYIRPLYVESEGDGPKIPALRNVLVSYKGIIGYDNSLDEALRKVGLGALVGNGVANIGNTPDSPPTTNTQGSNGSGSVSVLSSDAALSKALDLLKEADASLAKNDLGGYQKKINEAKQLLQDRETQLAKKQTGEPSATTSPKASMSSTTLPPTTLSPTTTAPPA
jgi:uncharacterized protein